MILRKVFIFIFCIILGLLFHGWAALALYYCSFPSLAVLRVLAAIFYLSMVIIFVFLSQRHARDFLLSLLGFVAVVIWFSTIQPKAGGQYPPELTMPFVELKGDVVRIHNVRYCTYRTAKDFDVHYEKRSYRLNDLETLDLLVNYWGMKAIAHTFLSFGFSDGQYVSVSVEIRPEVGKTYDMLQGFFKQYQLIYVWADERDLIGLRTNYKKEEVYLYRVDLSRENIRKMFMSMIKATNDIYNKPQFYNTLTQSCTNTLANHVIDAKIAKIPFWKRRILTGTVDRRLYEAGFLDQSLPFAQLRQRAHIDARAQAAGQGPQFSARIRTHLDPVLDR